MSKFFEAMMPDNLEEFLLLSGVTATGVVGTNYFYEKSQGIQKKHDELVGAFEKQYQDKLNLMKEKEDSLLKQLERRCLSPEAYEFIRTL